MFGAGIDGTKLPLIVRAILKTANFEQHLTYNCSSKTGKTNQITFLKTTSSFMKTRTGGY